MKETLSGGIYRQVDVRGELVWSDIAVIISRVWL